MSAAADDDNSGRGTEGGANLCNISTISLPVVSTGGGIQERAEGLVDPRKSTAVTVVNVF